ncbi:MAG: hypothetical protein OXJ62_11685 [Spirochaetaceae bacterium]|nr:hypothetical protein [Spirochaetaceae bacterium]
MTDTDYVKLLGIADAQAIALRLQRARPKLRSTEQDIAQVVGNIISDVYRGSRQTNTILDDDPAMLEAYRASLMKTLVKLGYLPAPDGISHTTVSA